MQPCLQVLALGTGLQDRSNLFWWQPTQPAKGAEAGGAASASVPWAPWALALEIGSDGMHAQEADSVDLLAPQSPGCTARSDSVRQ